MNTTRVGGAAVVYQGQEKHGATVAPSGRPYVQTDTPVLKSLWKHTATPTLICHPRRSSGALLEVEHSEDFSSFRPTAQLMELKWRPQ